MTVRYVLLALVIASAAVVARLRARQKTDQTPTYDSYLDDDMAGVQVDVRPYRMAYPRGTVSDNIDWRVGVPYIVSEPIGGM